MFNNSGYLLLPDCHVYRNLGSKVLSLCLKRLSADWEKAWGQPVLAVESFVREHKGYEGTCYKACGFETAGPSAGYGRSRRDYGEAALFDAMRGHWKCPCPPPQFAAFPC